MAHTDGHIPLFSSPEEYFFEADRLISENDVNGAFRLLNELLERFPDFGRAYNHLGFIYETKYRDFQKAEECYKKCLALSPDYPALYLNYAVLLSSQERFEELEGLLGKALNCPGIRKNKIYNEYAIMFEVQGRYETSIEHYQLAIRYAFKDSEITTYEASIQRVRQKQALLN